jgi:hypothetical protein
MADMSCRSADNSTLAALSTVKPGHDDLCGWVDVLAGLAQLSDLSPS